MTNWIDLLNFAFAVAGLNVALLGLLLSVISTPLDRKDRLFFTTVFSLIIAYVLSDLLEQLSIVALGAHYVDLTRIAVFAESLFSSMLMPVLTVYLLRCAGEEWRKAPVFAAAGVLWLVYLALLIATQFSNVIYYYTPDNVYHRGPWYPVLLVPPALLMLVNLAAMYRRRKVLSRRQLQAFSTYILIPLVSMLVQMAFYGLLMIVIGTSVAAFCMLVFILRDQIERYVAQQEENARQRASINVLQMRPHFIYNTMTSIYYLCGQDVKKAQTVILDFTSYLRQNFTAIVSENMIPFPQELEHARAYLAVEKARYEDKLFVEYDTAYTAFRLPPLTLQPLVENAVKHGLSPDLCPLYLSISTRENEYGVEVVVEDTGPGFSQSDDDEPHIALANIRERLKAMCDGRLVLEQRNEGGTIARLVIPK